VAAQEPSMRAGFRRNTGATAWGPLGSGSAVPAWAGTCRPRAPRPVTELDSFGCAGHAADGRGGVEVVTEKPASMAFQPPLLSPIFWTFATRT
jgi:hypothetical protein